jgi:hypothetical protein
VLEVGVRRALDERSKGRVGLDVVGSNLLDVRAHRLRHRVDIRLDLLVRDRVVGSHSRFVGDEDGLDLAESSTYGARRRVRVVGAHEEVGEESVEDRNARYEAGDSHTRASTSRDLPELAGRHCRWRLSLGLDLHTVHTYQQLPSVLARTPELTSSSPYA